MKTAVFVVSHARVNRTVARHFPHYRRSGGDVIFVGDQHTGCEWPAGAQVVEFPEIECRRTRLLRRFFEVIRWFVTHGEDRGYERCAIGEYDAIYIRPIPDGIGTCESIFATRAGQKSQGFRGKYFYHCPWIFGLEAARYFDKMGGRMLDSGVDEGGFIDRFIGLYDDLHGPAVLATENYSQNTIDRPEYLEACLRQMQNPNCFAIHGVKQADQLEAITSALRQ